MAETDATFENITTETNVLPAKENSERSRIERLLSNSRVILSALWNGIPLELSFVVSPEIQEELLKEYQKTLQKIRKPSIRDQVHIMLRLLQTYFPNLQEHSHQWMYVRAHFFGKIGLWGKFG